MEQWVDGQEEGRMDGQMDRRMGAGGEDGGPAGPTQGVALPLGCKVSGDQQVTPSWAPRATDSTGASAHHPGCSLQVALLA